MANTFLKLHGTTVDTFSIGSKTESITHSGTTVNTGSTTLVDREGNQYTASGTVFFTAYIVCQASGGQTGAFEIKGCYLSGVSGVSGAVTNTFVNTSTIPAPTISFNTSGLMSIGVSGISSATLNWTARVDFIKI
jgi:hypothetical protein